MPAATEGRAGRRWPAIVVAALIVALAGTITAWAAVTPHSLRTASAHDTVKLESASGSIDVDAIPGWQVAQQSEDTLKLTHSGDTVIVDALTVTPPEPSLSTMFARTVRTLTQQHVTAVEEAKQHTSHGYRGVNGTAAGNGKLGRLSVLRNGDLAVSVLVLADPDALDGYRPQLNRLYDSITEAAT